MANLRLDTKMFRTVILAEAISVGIMLLFFVGMQIGGHYSLDQGYSILLASHGTSLAERGGLIAFLAMFAFRFGYIERYLFVGMTVLTLVDDIILFRSSPDVAGSWLRKSYLLRLAALELIALYEVEKIVNVFFNAFGDSSSLTDKMGVGSATVLVYAFLAVVFLGTIFRFTACVFMNAGGDLSNKRLILMPGGNEGRQDPQNWIRVAALLLAGCFALISLYTLIRVVFFHGSMYEQLQYEGKSGFKFFLFCVNLIALPILHGMKYFFSFAHGRIIPEEN